MSSKPHLLKKNSNALPQWFVFRGTHKSLAGIYQFVTSVEDDFVTFGPTVLFFRCQANWSKVKSSTVNLSTASYAVNSVSIKLESTRLSSTTGVFDLK